MAITLEGLGKAASQSSGTGVTPGAPSSPQNGDIWICVAHETAQVALSMHSDWTQVAQGNGGGTLSRLGVWWYRYSGSGPTNRTVSRSSTAAPLIARIQAFRGCKSTGSPINVQGTIQTGTDSTVDASAVTTTVADCYALIAGGCEDNQGWNSGPNNGFSEIFESQISTGNGGTVTLNGKTQASAGSTGATTIATSFSRDWAALTFALEPDTLQTIAPSSITSAEAFGTAKTNRNILPSSIASAEAFGTQQVVGDFETTITPSSINSAETFGTARMVHNVHQESIPSAEAFGTSQLNFKLFPGAVSSAEAFGNTEVQADQTVTASSIASAEAFGTAKLNRYVVVEGMASAEAFGTTNVIRVIHPSAIASAEAFGSIQQLSRTLPINAGIASAEAFGTAKLNRYITPSGIATTEAFGSARVVKTIHPAPIASAEAFGSIQQLSRVLLVNVGIASTEGFGTASLSIPVRPAAIASAEAFGLAKINQYISTSAITSAEAFGTAKVNQYIVASVIASAEAFGSSVIRLTIHPASIASAEAFGDTVVEGGLRLITPNGIASAEAFGTAKVNLWIHASSIATAEAFGTAKLNQYITPAGVGSAEAFGSAMLRHYISTSSIESAETFGTAKVNLWIQRVGGIDINPELFPNPSVEANLNNWIASGSVTASRVQFADEGIPAIFGQWAYKAVTGATNQVVNLVSSNVLEVLRPYNYGIWVYRTETASTITLEVRNDANNTVRASIVLAATLGWQFVSVESTHVGADNDIRYRLVISNSGVTVYMDGATVVAANQPVGLPSLVLNILPVAIASAEAFGTAISSANQNVNPSSITSAEAFGVARLLRYITPSSVASAEAFGSAKVNQYISPSGIATSEMFGAANLRYTGIIEALGIASAEAFGALTVIRGDVKAFLSLVHKLAYAITLEHENLSRVRADDSEVTSSSMSHTELITIEESSAAVHNASLSDL